MFEKTGMPADRAGPITESIEASTVTSPPIQIASAPRPMTEATASRTPAELSTFASSSSIPSSRQTVRAIFVHASELASDGFQATPTLRQPGRELPGHAEGLGHRLHRAEPDHVRGVLHRVVARDPHAGGDRVAHHPEDMADLRVAVGPGHRLKAGRRQRDDQVVFTPDELASDRVRRRGVSLGVEPAKPDRVAVAVAGRGEARDHALGPFFDDRLGDVLKERDREDSLRLRRIRVGRSQAGALAPLVGQQQHRRGHHDQEDAERQSEETLDHSRNKRGLGDRAESRGAYPPRGQAYRIIGKQPRVFVQNEGRSIAPLVGQLLR